MLNKRQMIAGLRDLALSTQKNVCSEITGVEPALYELYRSYGDVMVVKDARTSESLLFSYKFLSDSYEEFGITLRVNIDTYDHRVAGYIEEGETALTFFKRLFAQAASELRAEPSEGFVKTFLSTVKKTFWVLLPVDSASLVEYNGEFYHAEYVSEFHRVHTSRTQCRWVHCDDFNSGLTYLSYAGEYYTPEIMVPIYHNSIPFNEVSACYPEWIAQERFQTVIVDNETRFIMLERPTAAFFKKDIHSYTTRIETIVPSESLFQKGKTDLYANRPNDETPFLGWELEACTNESGVPKNDIAKEFKSRLPFLVMAKADSSISPEGFETVSVPATLDFWKETELADTLDAMRVTPYKMRSFKHSSCGFHVHVSRSALSLLDLQKLERFMHNPANRGNLQLLAGRNSNTYQNYTDALFNNRKSLVRPSTGFNYHNSREGITYFNGDGTGESIGRQININEVRLRYGQAGDPLYYLLYTYWGDMVSYASLNEVSGGMFNTLSPRAAPPPGQEYTDEQKNFLKRMCEVSPFFRWKFDDFFASIRDELPSITYTSPSVLPTKVGGLVKTSLPLGRKNSFAAAQASKGAVGKGMQRYDVLNTKNANTVEFRLFKGTMNPTTVFRYFEFVDGIVRFVATTTATDEGLTFDKFVNWVMQDPFNVTRYENLVAFFVENKLYKRESIKRRYLPECKPEDGDLNVAPKPKTTIQEEENKPLYSINSLVPTQVILDIATLPLNVEVDPEYDDEEEEEYQEYEDPECNCDDCLRARGEFDDL